MTTNEIKTTKNKATEINTQPETPEEFAKDHIEGEVLEDKLLELNHETEGGEQNA